MSDHGAAIWSSAQEARPRGQVAHEPRRALIIPEPEIDGEPSPSLPVRISTGAEQQKVKMRQRIALVGDQLVGFKDAIFRPDDVLKACHELA